MVLVEPLDEERGPVHPRAGEVRFHGDRRSSPSFMPPRATARHPNVLREGVPSTAHAGSNRRHTRVKHSRDLTVAIPRAYDRVVVQAAPLPDVDPGEDEVEAGGDEVDVGLFDPGVDEHLPPSLEMEKRPRSSSLRAPD